MKTILSRSQTIMSGANGDVVTPKETEETFCWEHFHRICYSASSGQLSFRLTVYPPPQFLQINGRFYHASPASPSGRRNQTQHGPFAPETLLSFFAPTGHSAILLPSAPFPCQQL